MGKNRRKDNEGKMRNKYKEEEDGQKLELKKEGLKMNLEVMENMQGGKWWIRTGK